MKKVLGLVAIAALSVGSLDLCAMNQWGNNQGQQGTQGGLGRYVQFVPQIFQRQCSYMIPEMPESYMNRQIPSGRVCIFPAMQVTTYYQPFFIPDQNSNRPSANNAANNEAKASNSDNKPAPEGQR